MKTVTISPAVAEVLRAASCDGNELKLVGTLDRKLYVETNKVLEILGGKWNRGKAAHVFSAPAAGMIAEALGDGSVVDKKRSWEQFDTPVALAQRMVGLAAIKHTDDVLEPSAGLGAIVHEIPFRRPRPGGIYAVEIDPARCQALREIPHLRVTNMDFLAYAAAVKPNQGSEFDVVLMNPPFSRNQDVDHVLAAWEMLRAGGRLVAIMSPHSSFAEDGKSAKFRNWARAVDAAIEQLPAGTFSESGTEIRAQLIFAQKL